MATFADPLLWCVIQVTLIALLALAVCAAVRRWQIPGAAAIPAAALAAVVVLTICTFLPWPDWWRFGPRLSARDPHSAASHSRPAASSENDSQPADGDGAVRDQSPRRSAPARNDAAANVQLRDAALPDSDPPALVETQRSDLFAITLPGALPWVGTAIAVILGVGVLAGLLQLLGGLISVRACRLRSRRVDDRNLLELLDVLQAEIGLVRPIELRESRELTTAATIGWRRPAILLPASWQDWTSEQRRAVLAHELAHVAGGDYVACILAQLGLALHFYHPLVHWLVARLRLEQELAADATAAAVAGGRRVYLTSLAELALHSQERSLGWPAHTFLPTPGTFLRRIEMLRDSKPDQAAPSRRRRAIQWLAVGALLCGAALIAGLRGGPAISPFDREAAAQTRPAGEGGASASDAVDLTYVTNDAKMFLAIRPAHALAQEEIRAAFSDASAAKFPALAFLSVENLDQITLLGPAGMDLGNPDNDLIVVLQFSRPAKIEDVVKTGLIPREIKHLSAADDAGANQPGADMSYAAPNDKTIVLGKSEALGRYLVNRRKGKPAIAAGEAWQKVQNGALVAALDMEIIRNDFAKHRPQGEVAAQFDALSPLWQDSEYACAGIILEGKSVHFRAVVTCDSAELAGDVADTTQAAVTLARNTLRTAREREPNLPAFAQLAIQTAEGLLKTMKVERTDALVVAQTSTTVPEVKAVAAGGLVDAVSKARENARRQVSMNNLKQIMLAMHSWADVHGGRFPPPVIYGKDGKGKVPHSWRVEILPYLEQAALYEAYNFDEPWDSETNKKVLAQIPPFFRHPLDDARSTSAAYFVLATEPLLAENAEVQLPTAFSRREGVPFAEIVDGTSYTLAVVEAKRDIPWTRPDDILFDPEKDPPSLGGYTKEGFNAALCDGSVRFISSKIDPKILKFLITPQDGTPLPPVP
jgi:beta-lactamase regulating signal transducer with metallopeptidase domain